MLVLAKEKDQLGASSQKAADTLERVHTESLAEIKKLEERLSVLAKEKDQLGASSQKAADALAWVQSELEKERSNKTMQESAYQQKLLAEHQMKNDLARDIDKKNETIRNLQEDIKKLLAARERLNALEKQLMVSSRKSITDIATMFEDVSVDTKVGDDEDTYKGKRPDKPSESPLRPVMTSY